MTTSRSRHIFFQNNFLVSSHIQHSPGIKHFWIFKDQPVIHTFDIQNHVGFHKVRAPNYVCWLINPWNFASKSLASTLSTLSKTGGLIHLQAGSDPLQQAALKAMVTTGDPPGILIKNPNKGNLWTFQKKPKKLQWLFHKCFFPPLWPVFRFVIFIYIYTHYIYYGGKNWWSQWSMHIH